MKQYIERSELVERINKYVELTNPEEQEWVKDECIRQVHAMLSVNVGEWISVEERLPDQDGKYLAYTRRGFTVLSYYYALEGAFGFEFWDVTHWMPLPEAPKMKEGEWK